MSDIDFQNGLAVGLTLMGRSGTIGGEAPEPPPGILVELDMFISGVLKLHVDLV